MSAGDEGNNDADFVDGQTASPLRRATGGLVGGFQEINFCGFETFRGNGRVRLARPTAGGRISLVRGTNSNVKQRIHSSAISPRIPREVCR